MTMILKKKKKEKKIKKIKKSFLIKKWYREISKIKWKIVKIQTAIVVVILMPNN